MVGFIRFLSIRSCFWYVPILNNGDVFILRTPCFSFFVQYLWSYSYYLVCIGLQRSCRRRGLTSGEPTSPARAKEEREAALKVWESRLATPSAGRLTIGAVRPLFRQWLAWRHGVQTFRTTQVLTRHGCFGGYLCRIGGRDPTPAVKEKKGLQRSVYFLLVLRIGPLFC